LHAIRGAVFLPAGGEKSAAAAALPSPAPGHRWPAERLVNGNADSG